MFSFLTVFACGFLLTGGISDSGGLATERLNEGDNLYLDTKPIHFCKFLSFLVHFSCCLPASLHSNRSIILPLLVFAGSGSSNPPPGLLNDSGIHPKTVDGERLFQKMSFGQSNFLLLKFTV